MLKMTVSLLLLSLPVWAKPIHEAAQRNDCFAALKILRQDPGQLNARDAEHGNTPLHWAAYKGNLQMVQLLVEQGADLNATTVEGYTPLRDAIYKNHHQVFNYLLEQGANPKLRDRRGATLLHWAAAAGAITNLPIPIDTQDNDGLFPADWAAEVGQKGEAARYLAGMVLEDKLTQVGAFLDRHPQCVDLRMYNDEYLTPLCFARSATMAELLIRHGAKVNVLVSEDGDGALINCTPLHTLAGGGKASVVEVLLRHGANPRSRASGCSPLYRAALGCKPEVIKLLLDWGADPTRDDLLWLVAASRGSRLRARVTDAQMISSARLLLAAGASPRGRKYQGMTLVEFARSNGNPALARFLEHPGS